MGSERNFQQEWQNRFKLMATTQSFCWCFSNTLLGTNSLIWPRLDNWLCYNFKLQYNHTRRKKNRKSPTSQHDGELDRNPRKGKFLNNVAPSFCFNLVECMMVESCFIISSNKDPLAIKSCSLSLRSILTCNNVFQTPPKLSPERRCYFGGHIWECYKCKRAENKILILSHFTINNLAASEVLKNYVVPPTIYIYIYIYSLLLL